MGLNEADARTRLIDPVPPAGGTDNLGTGTLERGRRK